MRLQIASRIAIVALLDLAGQPERQLSVAELGKKYRLSSHHLAKVMNRLGRAGMVSAGRGVGGGYQFIGNPRRITLLDVIELFEDLGSKEDERGGPSGTTAEGALLRQVLAEIDAFARSTFGSITIATMLKMRALRKDARSSRKRPAASRLT